MTVARVPYGAVRTTAHPEDESRVLPVVRAAMILFIASIPFELPSAPLPLEVPVLTGLLLLGTSLLNPRATLQRVPDTTLAFVIYLWAFLVVMALVGVTHRQLAVRLFINMVILVALLHVLANLFSRPSELRAGLLAFITACAARAGIQLLGIATESREVWTGGARITTLGQNANLSAIILSAGLICAIGVARSRLDPPRWLRVGAWPLAVILGAAIIQTGSRGGLLCAAVGIAIFCIRGESVVARIRSAALAVIGIAILAYGAWNSDMMRHRLEESATEGRLAGREVIYPATWQMVLERPWFGWGPLDNQFEIARRINERDLPRRDAHNLLLELLSATGVVGALPFLAGLALTVRHALRGRHGPAGIVPVAMLATVLVGTVSGTWIASKILWLAFAVASASDTATEVA